RVCRETGIRPSLPLWKNSRERLLREFIGKGFKAVIVALRTDRLGREWLGRELDERFITEIRAEKNIDICGEEGEYHTFVYDGPLFKRPVAVKPGRPASRAGYLFYL
ncbi:MAG: hypothetical protein JW821_16835, partial [Deltaproteobacteria bacterium]|nr:hypothetical protein [Deltaproteobacteria bacterium]